MKNLIYKIVDPTDSPLMEKIHRLRYEVYVQERGFIKHEDSPMGLERDEYDNQAIHFAALDGQGEVVGTVRLILPGKEILPLRKHCHAGARGHDRGQQGLYAEISRLIVNNRLREGRNIRKHCVIHEQHWDQEEHRSDSYRCVARCATIGLCGLVYEESMRRGITHWYALMERSLWWLLRLHGFTFRCIGQEIDFFGPVHPYLADLNTIERAILNFLLRYDCPLLENTVLLPNLPRLEDPFGLDYQSLRS